MSRPTRPFRGPSELRLAALVACALWLLGVELLPGHHVGLHGRLAPHVHDGEGPGETGPVVTVHVDDGWHSHGTGGHVHDVAAPAPDLPPRGVHAPAPTDPSRHAAHSLAHRTLAIAPPPIAVVAPIAVPRVVVPVAHPIAHLAAVLSPPDPAARAPPVTSIVT